MRSAMQWTVMDDLMVCVTSAEEPDRATVARFLEELRTKPIRRIVSTPMSLSDDLGAEREMCGEICVSRGIKVALVVDSSLAPAFESIAGMTRSNVATFSWEELDGALAHLGVRGPAAASVLSAIDAMRADLGAIAA